MFSHKCIKTGQNSCLGYNKKLKIEVNYNLSGREIHDALSELVCFSNITKIAL